MYVIAVYDVSVDRVNKVKKFLRMHLTWVQNSVLEGEVTESQLMKIKKGLLELIHSDTDSVRLYILSSDKLLRKEILGISKGDSEDNVF